MLNYDFEESIGCRLVRAWHAYERALNAELLPRGITFRQAQVLGTLAYEGDLTQAELADHLRVEPPTLVGILDRMERDGWISRHDCANDRRKKIIRPTQQAEPVWAAIVDAALRVRARAVAGLSVDEVDQLRRLLQKIEANAAADQPVEEHA
jgi:MarR family transcriptional regulator for hemolysin